VNTPGRLKLRLLEIVTKLAEHCYSGITGTSLAQNRILAGMVPLRRKPLCLDANRSVRLQPLNWEQ